MQSDVPTAGMLKSYKKVSRWYPALDPVSDTAPESSGSAASFDDEDRPARFPYYIHDDEEPELEIPPVPDSFLRRSHFSGAWSDWMTGRDSSDLAAPARSRDSTVLEFPWGSAEDDSESHPAHLPRHPAGHTPAPDRSTLTDRASALLDAVADYDPAAARADIYRRRRLFALGLLIVAIVLLILVFGIALYALNSHGGASQSIGVPVGAARFDPVAAPSAYNEMTATATIGHHARAAGIPAG